jgi:hypothetical protein
MSNHQRNLTAELVDLLVEAGEIDSQSGFIDSVEGSTGMPDFANKAQEEALIEGLRERGRIARRNLERDFPHLAMTPPDGDTQSPR